MYIAFVHKVPRLIKYPGLGKCWAVPGKSVPALLFTDSVSGLYGQKVYIYNGRERDSSQLLHPNIPMNNNFTGPLALLFGLEHFESFPPNSPLNHLHKAIIEFSLRSMLGKEEEKRKRMKDREERNLPSPLVLNTEWLERVPPKFSVPCPPELFMASFHTAYKVAEKNK
jgi:hypothetical protein